MADWDTDRIEQSHLRERLNDIASDVSRLVYALEGNGPPDSEESLFDRVQKFAGEAAQEPEQVRGPRLAPATSARRGHAPCRTAEGPARIAERQLRPIR